MIGSPDWAGMNDSLRGQRSSSLFGMKIHPVDCLPRRRSSGEKDRMIPPERKSPARMEDVGQSASPRSVWSPRVVRHRPMVISKVLDAPEVVTEFPAKLIDFNRRNQLAVALGCSIYIWADEQVTQLMEADSEITGLCWADDHLVISARGEVELWDANRSTIIQPLTRHSGRCCSMAFRGHRVATGSADASVRVTDLRGSCVSTFAGHHREVLGLAWSPDGVHLASASLDNRVIVWGDRKRRSYEFSAPIQGLVYLTPTVLAVGESSEPGTLRFLSGRAEESSISVNTGASISGVAFSDHWGVFVAHRHTSFQWELWSHELRRMGQYSGHTGDILNINVSYDGTLAATIGADETLQVWQLRDGRAHTPVVAKRPASLNGGPFLR